ncbi:MAG: AI-2E family transporter [Phycisphaerae bacterium]|nr:AI-2E family transporter [Phycisphaerae bacterium]
MKAAVDIVVPFLMAVFLAIISTPGLFWLKKKGISTPFAILLVSLVILLAGLLIGTVLTTSIADFTKDLPQYTKKLDEDLQSWEQRWNHWLDQQRDRFSQDNPNKAENNASQTPPLSVTTSEPEPDKKPLSITRFLDAQAGMQLMGDLLSQLGGIVADGFLIYLTMIFILLEASILPGKIKATMKNAPDTFDNLSTIAGDVKKYLAMKTAISLATGIIITVWLIILGVKYPIVWGLIAFLLNFVPNIGSIIAAIPACALALVQLGVGSAVLTGFGYLVVNVLIGNFIEPRLMGRRLGLSTLVVFLSLVFWGWVLGPMGMLLSVPLTMTVKIALQSHPDTRTLALLLGSENPPPQTTKNKHRS